MAQSLAPGGSSVAVGPALLTHAEPSEPIPYSPKYLEGVFSEVWEFCIASVPCDMQPPSGVGSPSSFLARCGRDPAPRSGMAHTSVCDKGG